MSYPPLFLSVDALRNHHCKNGNDQNIARVAPGPTAFGARLLTRLTARPARLQTTKSCRRKASSTRPKNIKKYKKAPQPHAEPF